MYRYIEIYTPSQDGTHDIILLVTVFTLYTDYSLLFFFFPFYLFSLLFYAECLNSYSHNDTAYTVSLSETIDDI